jgi:hypothetical protein
VKTDDEVDRAQVTNPRTALGVISPLHYLFIVSDGRTDESTGLSLLQLAELMKELGCRTAYNLDGGGSSTIWSLRQEMADASSMTSAPMTPKALRIIRSFDTVSSRNKATTGRSQDTGRRRWT